MTYLSSAHLSIHRDHGDPSPHLIQISHLPLHRIESSLLLSSGARALMDAIEGCLRGMPNIDHLRHAHLFPAGPRGK